MPNAACLHHIRWRKKKVDGFIIPAKYFYGRIREIVVEAAEVVEAPGIRSPQIPAGKTEIEISEVIQTPDLKIPTLDASPDSITETLTLEPALKKVSALSLASIRAKKELQQAARPFANEEKQLPIEPFTETDMLIQWNKYAQKLGDKGHKIMESLLLINDPKLDGTTIIHELPNEGSKIEFENEMTELQGYLRGKLHNHDIKIEVYVNESVENKFAFTAQDKFNRLNQINPVLDVLKKTFDLDLNS